VSSRLLKQFIVEVIGSSMRGSRRFEAPGNVRYGVNTTGATGRNTVLDSEEEEEHEMSEGPQAAVCLIMAEDGTILAVSRKDDPTAWGLPGGKVDPGETPEEAAIRELKEETGLDVVNLRKIFVRGEGDGYTTHCFATEAVGEINTGEAGVVRWVTLDELLAGPFGPYNRQLFKKIGRL